MNILNRDLIKINLDVEKCSDVIKILGNLMYGLDNVKDTYTNAVIEREKVFPTGLPGKDMCIAIPHTDSKHVNRSCMAVATLKNPVEFSMMGNPDTKLGVDVVFLLAIKDPDNQLLLLKNLMNLIQSRQLLNKVKSAKSVDDVMEVLQACAIN